jgi:ketosteroid isomerase-like protein
MERFEPIVKMVTPAMAFCVWVEYASARFGNRETIDSFALRVTVIFRREDEGWKLVHRHADAVTETRPIEQLAGN